MPRRAPGVFSFVDDSGSFTAVGDSFVSDSTISWLLQAANSTANRMVTRMVCVFIRRWVLLYTTVMNIDKTDLLTDCLCMLFFVRMLCVFDRYGIEQ